MSQQSLKPPNNQIEARLVEAAVNFPYPPTPNIAGIVKQQLATRRSHITRQTSRLVWATLIMLFILAGLLAVPQVRAAVVELLQLGAIRIFLVEPTPTAPPPAPTASPKAVSTATSRPSPTPLTSVLNLAGQTTLAEAQAQVDFPIRLPTVLSDLGPPDQVFLQDLGGPAVVLVWLDRTRPGQVHLSLHQLGANTFVEKVQPQVKRETTVHGKRALWTEGPYLLQLRDGGYQVQRLVEGHVLIWQEGQITYRLESNLSLEEAVGIAESLR